jgi:hypothetical protein
MSGLNLEERIAEMKNSILDLMLQDRAIQKQVQEKLLKLDALERSREIHPLRQYFKGPIAEIQVGS